MNKNTKREEDCKDNDSENGNEEDNNNTNASCKKRNINLLDSEFDIVKPPLKKQKMESEQEISYPIVLNVGGIKYETTASTLKNYDNSFFVKMFSGNFSLEPSKDGSYFIDRSGKYFEYILDYLRNGIVNIQPTNDQYFILQHLFAESNYYGIEPLVKSIKIKLIKSAPGLTAKGRNIKKMVNEKCIKCYSTSEIGSTALITEIESSICDHYSIKLHFKSTAKKLMLFLYIFYYIYIYTYNNNEEIFIMKLDLQQTKRKSI